MSTKELVYSYIERLNESQLNAIIAVLKQFDIPMYQEIEPDEDELRMIAESEADNSDPQPIEDFAERLGIDV